MKSGVECERPYLSNTVFKFGNWYQTNLRIFQTGVHFVQMQMKFFDEVLCSVLVFTVGTIVLADSTQIPPPKITSESVNTKVVEGHYLISGPKYKSTASITQPPGTQVYMVYQYTGPTVTKGIGFMSNGQFIIGWEQEKALGVTSIRFRNGKGIAKWVSNPGNGRVGHETWSLIDDEN